MLKSFGNGDFAWGSFGFAHAAEHTLQLRGHLFHAWGGHYLHTHGALAQFNLNFFVIEGSFAEFFAEYLSSTCVFFIG